MTWTKHTCQSVFFLHSISSLRLNRSINENTEDNLLSLCAWGEGESVSISGWLRGFKGWSKKLGISKWSSVPVLYQARKLSWDRTVSLLRNEGWRQHPKNKQQAGIDRYLCALFYPVCSVLVSCLWYPFLQNRFCLNFLSTVWFFLHHNSSPSSRFLLFRTRTQYDWCVPQTSELSCWPHAFTGTVSPPKGNGSHKVRSRGLWIHAIF